MNNSSLTTLTASSNTINHKSPNIWNCVFHTMDISIWTQRQELLNVLSIAYVISTLNIWVVAYVFCVLFNFFSYIYFFTLHFYFLTVLYHHIKFLCMLYIWQIKWFWSCENGPTESFWKCIFSFLQSLSFLNQCTVKIKIKWWTPNDQPGLSGANWLFAMLCHCVYKSVSVLVHGCVFIFLSMAMPSCVFVCEGLCEPHRECVLCDPGNADQRMNRRTNKRWPPSIHLVALTGLIRPVSIYWSMRWCWVVFVGWSWQPDYKAPWGTQKQVTLKYRAREREKNTDPLKYKLHGALVPCCTLSHWPIAYWFNNSVSETF